MRYELNEEIEIPEGIQVRLEGDILVVKGPKGESKRNFAHPKINIKIKDKQFMLLVEKASKREKKTVNTCLAHVKNMFKGVNEGHVYKMKICSGHFPMTAAVNGKQFVVKNFLGEKAPRVLTIKEGATVKVNDKEVEVQSTDKETAGQVAADIEQLTKVGNRRDIRIFQDGIFIVEKSGKSML